MSMGMTNLRTLALAILAIPGGLLQADPRTYEIRPSEGARLELTVEKTGLYSGRKHVFTFERYSGTMTFDPDDPANSSVSVAIESGSIACHDTWVSGKDLQKIMQEATRNMLAADRFPAITFQSSTVESTGNGTYQVMGTLTIRGISKPAKLAVTAMTSGKSQLTFEGGSVVRLTDYGLKPPSAVLGAIGTKNEMQFRLNVIARPAGNGGNS
jgi:polyisoprenoid-binding protein YceI